METVVRVMEGGVVRQGVGVGRVEKRAGSGRVSDRETAAVGTVVGTVVSAGILAKTGPVDFEAVEGLAWRQRSGEE